VDHDKIYATNTKIYSSWREYVLFRLCLKSRKKFVRSVYIQSNCT
jgi:hypothetical protein